MAWQTRPMVCRSPTDRKNVSVGLKSEWSWNTKKSQAYFSFLERTFPFPRSPFRTDKTSLHLVFANCPSLRSRKRKSSLSEKKLRLRVFPSLSDLFPAARNYYSIFYTIDTSWVFKAGEINKFDLL